MRVAMIILTIFMGLLNEPPTQLENLIVMEKSSFELSVSDQVQIKVSATGVDNPVFTFESSNPAVASVSSTGLVSGVSAGTTKIKVSLVREDFEDQVVFADVSVKGLDGGISFSVSEFYLIRGLTYDVDYTLTGAFVGESVSWNSSNTNVASVENGRITGHKIGVSTISAQVHDVRVEMTLHVTVPLAQVSFNPSSVSMIVDDVRDIPDLVFVPYDTTSSRYAEYTSSNEAIIMVEGDSLRAMGVGDATIEVNVGGIRSSLKVHVKPKTTESGAEILNLQSKQNGDVFELFLDPKLDFKANKFALVFPTAEMIDFVNGHNEPVFVLRLNNILLRNSMGRIDSLLFPKEVLDLIDEEVIVVRLVDEKNQDQLAYRFDRPAFDSVNLKHVLEEVNENTALFSKIGARAYHLKFNIPFNYRFQVEVPRKIIDSSPSQYHFIYKLEKGLPVDTQQVVSVDDVGMVGFMVDSSELIISFSRISVRNNFNLIVGMLSFIVLAGAGAGIYYFKSRKKREEL